MALTPEDKKDVKTHLGKALANKVSAVTRDKNRAASDAFRKSSEFHSEKESRARQTKEYGASFVRSGVKSKALSSKSGTEKGGFDYDGMMKDVRKSFPGLKVSGKSPYTDKHK